MPKACYLLALSLLLWPSTAGAQPLFRTERNWAIILDDRRFGLVQSLQIPGDFRRTQVWLGWYSFEIRGRAVEEIAPAFLAPLRLVSRIDWDSFRRIP
jgi:hypothetical protein